MESPPPPKAVGGGLCHLLHVQSLHQGCESKQVAHGVLQLHRHQDDAIQSGRPLLYAAGASQNIHRYTYGHGVVSVWSGGGLG